MFSYQRAGGAVAATAVVASGLVMGAAGTAQARPAAPAPAAHAPATTAAQRDLLDLIPLELPILSGLGDIGSLLSVTPPLWNLPGVTTDITWLQDGIPIPGTEGLWEYIPTDLDGGHQISAQITGTLLGLLPVTLLTSSLGIPLPGATAPTATTAPRLTGDPKVGKVLTAVPPVWSVDGVTNSYQWLRAGSPIIGATGTTYTLVPDDYAKAISVRVLGAKSGSDNGVATSAPLIGLLGDALTAGVPPSIGGLGRVGQLLSVSPGSWGAIVPSFSYQWLRKGAAIPGANGSTYVVQVADVARSLSVAVSATRVGYAVGHATTSGISVAKLSSTTTASLVKKKIALGKRGLLKVTLRASGARPVGSIKVYDAKKLLRTYTIKAADNGSRIFKLPKLKAGSHKLKAVYVGSSSFTGSTSRVVTLRVLRNK